MRRLIFHLLYVSICSSIYAQADIEELESAITKKDYEVSSRIASDLINSELAIERAYAFWAFGVANLSQNPDSANYLLNKALNENPDDLLKLKILNAQANYYDIVGATRKAIDLFMEVSALAVKHDSSFLAGVYNNLSISYRSLEMFDSATYYGFEGLRFAETFNQSFEQKRLYNSIAISYAIQGDLKVAGKYFGESLQVAIQNGDSTGASRGYVNLTQLKIDQGQIDSAKYFLNRAEMFNLNNKNALDIMDMYGLLAEVYMSEGNYPAALVNLDKAIESLNRLDFPSELVDLYLSKSQTYLEMGNMIESQRSLSDAQNTAGKLDVRIRTLEIARLQKAIYVRSGKLKKALSLDVIIDSLVEERYNDQKAKSVQDIREKYETAEKEQEILNLEQKSRISALKIRQQSILLIAAAALLIILVIVGYTIYRNRMLRMAQQRLLIEQKLLRSQMNPHFLFNALSSIHAFILKGDKREASDYLTTFSELTRDILDHSSKDWVSLENELKTLSKYIEVQKLRFPHIATSIHVDDKIDQSNVMVPPLLLQPFAENAFEHGFKGKSEGRLELSINEASGMIRMEMMDDGSGLNTSASGHKSKAIDIASERLAILFGKAKANLTVSNREEAGVVVTIEMPKEELL